MHLNDKRSCGSLGRSAARVRMQGTYTARLTSDWYEPLPWSKGGERCGALERQTWVRWVLTLAFLLNVSPVWSQSLKHLWSQGFGGDGAGWAIATDGAGGVLVTGWFGGTVDFGGGARTSAGAFTSDIFVAKYNAVGTHLWSRSFGDTHDDIGLAIAADGTGNVFVLGRFQGTVDFGGGALTSASAFTSDIFVAKFSAAGTHLWSHGFGDAGLDEGFGVAADGAGNVLVTGSFQGTVDFGGGALISTSGSSDIFVAKFSAAGTHLWSHGFGDTNLDLGFGVVEDGANNGFVTGYFQGAVDFGGGALTSTSGSTDIFVAKFSAAGTHLWSRRFGGTEEDIGLAIAADEAGNVLVTGFFEDTVDFGGGALTSASAFTMDIFVAKYNAAGTHLWSQNFGDTDEDIGLAIAADSSDNVLVTGMFQGTVDFGGGALTSASAFTSDIFVAKYNAAGAHLSSQRFGGAGLDQGNAIAANGVGDVLVTGFFEDTVDFGGGPLVSAGRDIFVAKFECVQMSQFKAFVSAKAGTPDAVTALVVATATASLGRSVVGGEFKSEAQAETGFDPADPMAVFAKSLSSVWGFPPRNEQAEARSDAESVLQWVANSTTLAAGTPIDLRIELPTDGALAASVFDGSPGSAATAAVKLTVQVNGILEFAADAQIDGSASLMFNGPWSIVTDRVPTDAPVGDMLLDGANLGFSHSFEVSGTLGCTFGVNYLLTTNASIDGSTEAAAISDFSRTGSYRLAAFDPATGDRLDDVTFRAVFSGLQLPGDCNQDGALDLSDAVCLLDHLFQNTPPVLPCSTAAANNTLMDCNDDGAIDLSDAIYKLTFLFQGGPAPAQGERCIVIAGCPQDQGCP